ncbi:hypothetical protein [Actinoplanes sp. RD1]|uniref:hypothetical protein n=1 Tax=Actinoplanes sp. RD1 TaxID=3064538 RepID=UPI00274185D7|nr:hypothetical protein [Actinoplanes sp. RD1]
MGGPRNGHPDPAALRQLAADWRAEGDRLETLGDNIKAAHRSVDWIGFASLSAGIAANLVDLKLRQVQDSAQEFAQFLDDYAEKVQEQIDRERAQSIIEVVLALLGLLTIGLAGVLGPVLAALGRLLAGLLTAMSQLAGRIVTAVIDVALGTVFWGSLQVAFEFGTTAVVSQIVGVTPEYNAGIAISVLIAAVVGGLFSFRGVNDVPLRTISGRPADAPAVLPSPKGGPGAGADVDSAVVDLPRPSEGTGGDVVTINPDEVAVSATDAGGVPFTPGSSHSVPTTSGADQRIFTGSGALGNAGRGAEHGNPQTVAHTVEHGLTTPPPVPQTATGAPGGAAGGRTIGDMPPGGQVTTGAVRTVPPGGDAVGRPPVTSNGDALPAANLGRGAAGPPPLRLATGGEGTPVHLAPGEVSPVSSLGGRSFVPGDVSPVSSVGGRGSLDLRTPVAGHGDPVAQPPTLPAAASGGPVPGPGAGRVVQHTVTNGPASVPHGVSLPPAMRPGGLPDLPAAHVTAPPAGLPASSAKVPADAAAARALEDRFQALGGPASSKAPVDAVAARALEDRFQALGGSAAKQPALPDVPRVEAPRGPADISGVRVPDQRPGAVTSGSAAPDAGRPLDAVGVRWRDDLFADTPATPSLMEQVKGLRGPKLPDVPGHEPGAVPRGAAPSPSPGAHGKLPDAPKDAPSDPVLNALDEAPAAPTGLERPKQLIDDLGGAAGLPRRELDDLVGKLSAYGDSVLGPDAESAVTRALVEDIGVRAGLDAHAARGFADRITSPDAAVSQAARAEFRTQVGASADLNRLTHRLVDMRIDHAEKAGVPMTQSFRTELTQALRAGDETAVTGVSGDLDRAVAARDVTRQAEADKAVRALDDRLDKLRSANDRDAVAASDAAAAEGAARDEFIHSFRDGLLAEIKQQAGESDASVELRTLEKSARPERDEFLAAVDAERAQQAQAHELHDLLASADDLGAHAGLRPEQIDQVRAEVETRYIDTLSLDEARLTLYEGVAGRAGMNPERAATLATRSLGDNVIGRHAMQVYRDELRDLRSTNSLIDRVVQQVGERFQELKLAFDEATRERLTQAYRQGDEAAAEEITIRLDVERALAERQAETAAFKAELELTNRFNALPRPEGPTASDPVTEPVGARAETPAENPQAPDVSVDAETQALFEGLDVPTGRLPHEDLPVLPDVPESPGLESLRAFGRDLAKDGGLDAAATEDLLKGIDDRWGPVVLDEAGRVEARWTLVKEMYRRLDATPDDAGLQSARPAGTRMQDLVGDNGTLRDAARVALRYELTSARKVQSLNERFAGLPELRAEDPVAPAAGDGDEPAARAVDQAVSSRDAFGKVLDELVTRPPAGGPARAEEGLPAPLGEEMLMREPLQHDSPRPVTRADLRYDPPPRAAAEPTPLEQFELELAERHAAAATAERDLHAAGLDADSRFRTAVADFRAANPDARFDLDAVRVDYDARIADAWRAEPLPSAWPGYVAAAAAGLPELLAQSEVGMGTKPAAEVRDPDRVIPEPAVAELAGEIFTRAAGIVDYEHGLDLPASVLDRMRDTFTDGLQRHYSDIHHGGSDERFAEDGGRAAVWEAYQERQLDSVRADLRLADRAWAAAQRAAVQFHALVGAGRLDSPDQALSELSLRAFGEQFATETLVLRQEHYYGLHELQQQAFREQLDELVRPVDDLAALDDAERDERWQQEKAELQADYARRLKTALLVEQQRPDLAVAFETALIEAAELTDRTGLATLDGLSPAAADAFRADFVTTGRRLFEETFAEAVRAGAHGYDSVFTRAETVWRHQYDHLRTALRQEAFVHLQVHRHDTALAAAVENYRTVSEEYGWDDVPETVYAKAREEFLADATAKLRASVREQLDPFAKSQAAHWDSLAGTIERSLGRYFNHDKLREYATRAEPPVPATVDAGRLAAPPAAYEEKAQPILDGVRDAVSAALRPDGREVPADVRDRVAAEIAAVVREADTAARKRAERGDNTATALAAATAELDERLSGLAASVPLRLSHQERASAELERAGHAFEGLLAPAEALPGAVTAGLSVAFANDWLTRHDRLFRGGAGVAKAAAVAAGLRELAGRVEITAPHHDVLSPDALRRVLLDVAATLPGGYTTAGSSVLLQRPGVPPNRLMTEIAAFFRPIPGHQRVIVAPGTDLIPFLTELTNRLGDPAQRSRVVVHAPMTPEPVLRTLVSRYGVTVAFAEPPAGTEPALPVTADGTPTLRRWAEHWLVRPGTEEPEGPYGLRRRGDSELFELPGDWVLEDLPWGLWARPASLVEPGLAADVRSGAVAGDAAIVVGVPGVEVPEPVVRAGLSLIGHLPVELGEPAVEWLSPLPELTPEAVPVVDLDTTLGGLSGVRTGAAEPGPASIAVDALRSAGHGAEAEAFLAEPDPALRDQGLIRLYRTGDAIRDVLPDLHLGLATPARSDAALAEILQLAGTALGGAFVVEGQMRQAARGLLTETRTELLSGLLMLVPIGDDRRPAVLRFAKVLLDC